MAAVVLAGAIIFGAVALAAAVQAWAVLTCLLLGVGAFCAWCAQCLRPWATFSSSSLRPPENRDAIDAAWLTLAFLESGLLTGNQRVVRAVLTGMSDETAEAFSGASLMRAALEYSGEGDLGCLPASAIIKFFDFQALQKDAGLAKKAGASRRLLLYFQLRGERTVQQVQMEHSMYRYLSSDGVRKQPWALKSPALYFEATIGLPKQQPSRAAVLFFGARAGRVAPGARAILITEDLVASGLHKPGAKGGLWQHAGPSGKFVLEPLARWHAAHWGCRGAAMEAQPRSCRGSSDRGKDVWALMVWRQTWAGLARLKLRGAPSGPCPFVEAIGHARETVYEAKGTEILRALSRQGVMAALRGLERAYGPLLVGAIREHLVDGTTASRNRTLLHGDVHQGNILLRFGPEAGADSQTCTPYFLDFQYAGRGHAVHDLLSANYFITRYPTRPLLETYYASLSAELPASVCYSWEDFLEDWSLEVASMACEFLVLLSLPKLALKFTWSSQLFTCRVLLLLEEVLHSDTKVGAILRGASVTEAGEGPRADVAQAPWPASVQLSERRGIRRCKTPGCSFQATWHPTNCCAACERGGHGPRCERKPYCTPAGASVASSS